MVYYTNNTYTFAVQQLDTEQIDISVCVTKLFWLHLHSPGDCDKKGLQFVLEADTFINVRKDLF